MIKIGGVGILRLKELILRQPPPIFSAASLKQQTGIFLGQNNEKINFKVEENKMRSSFFTIFGHFIQDMVIMLFSAGDLTLIVFKLLFSIFHYYLQSKSIPHSVYVCVPGFEEKNCFMLLPQGGSV